MGIARADLKVRVMCVTITLYCTPMERTMFRHLSRLILATSCLAISAPTWAQRGGGQPQGPPPNASTDPVLRGFEFRSIGPATMMGRVDDIQGSENDPMTIYLG